MIRVRKLSKAYNKEKVLDNISIDFMEGNIYVLKGVSGCGKTTLLNILAGLDMDFEGTVQYNGLNLEKRTCKKYREAVGYIFQQSLLLSNITILDNLKLICPDETKIQDYAQKFHVDYLLSKFPSQCSNGERQRIAIIRAMILDCPIILADEPTASLDLESSKDIANAFQSMKDDRRVIIIVTHEDCFDTIGSEIIQLDYGKVDDNHICTCSEIKVPAFPKSDEPVDYFKQDLQYAKTKRKRSSIMFSVCLSIIVCVSLLLLGAYFHLRSGLEAYVYENYPYQTMILSDDQLSNSKIPLDELHRYENYYMERDGVAYVPILPKKDSILNTKGMIELGAFPTDADEVLLNEKAAGILFSDTELKEILGKEIVFEGTTFKVCGILAEDLLYDIANSYPPYGQVFEEPTVFINYEQISAVAEPIEHDTYLYSIDKSDIMNEEWSLYLNKYSPYKDIVEAQLYSVEEIMQMLVLCIPVVLFLAFIFMFNMLYMEMYYRKLEIGYLQIFHISKYRIQRILYLEYVLKFILPIVCGYISYILISVLIYYVYDISFALSVLEVIASITFILLYLLLLVMCPLRLLLRQSILKLIKS